MNGSAYLYRFAINCYATLSTNMSKANLARTRYASQFLVQYNLGHKYKF